MRVLGARGSCRQALGAGDRRGRVRGAARRGRAGARVAQAGAWADARGPWLGARQQARPGRGLGTSLVCWLVSWAKLVHCAPGLVLTQFLTRFDSVYS